VGPLSPPPHGLSSYPEKMRRGGGFAASSHFFGVLFFCQSLSPRMQGILELMQDNWAGRWLGKTDEKDFNCR
jgi:hypothetical protein